MGTRRLALLRSRQGPWVPTGYMPKPQVKIVGLRDAVIRVEQRTNGVSVICHSLFDADGSYDIMKADWTRLHCEPHCKTVICELTSSSAD